MYPVKLKLTNFLSFKELEYDFINGPVLLVGENRTDDGQESNGSGKTAIQSAIEKCWLDYVSREKVRDADLIRRGADMSTIESWIHCPIRKQTLYIKRTLTKKGNKLELSLNDQPVSFATVNDGNDYIIDWIGISKEDLSNYYIVNRRRFISFFSSSNTQKLQLLGRFSNTNFLDKIDVDIKLKIQSYSDRLADLKNIRAACDGRIDLLTQQLSDCTQEKFLADQGRRIQEREVEIEEQEAHNIFLACSITECDKKIDGIRKLLEEKKDELYYITKSLNKEQEKCGSLDDRISTLEKELNDVQSKEKEKRAAYEEAVDTKNEIVQALADIENRLAGLITCPKCGHRFSLAEDINVETEEERRVAIRKLGDDIQITLKELLGAWELFQQEIKKKRSELQEERDKNDEILRRTASIKRKIIEVGNNIRIHTESIENEEKRKKQIFEDIRKGEEKIERIKNLIKEMKEEKFEDSWELKNLNEKLKEEKKYQGINAKEIEEKEEELRIAQEWLIQYKEFRMYLANISIKEIQARCNEVLKEMDSDLLVSIDGFKKKADGTLKDEITPTIIRAESLPFGLFSGGERGRLEYAMMLALQGVINKSNPNGGLSFLFTDEIAEGIDALGLKLLIKSLDKFNFPILITTHVVNQAVGSKTLKVIKENNVSRIEL